MLYLIQSYIGTLIVFLIKIRETMVFMWEPRARREEHEGKILLLLFYTTLKYETDSNA